MSKISIENHKGKYVITNRLTYPENINERVHNMIASGMFAGFLPISVYHEKKGIRLECTVYGMIPLTQYFNGMVSRKMFLELAHGVAEQVKLCEDNMINANNIDLQSDIIFIDPRTKAVKCIYWPVVNNQRDKPPQLFLKHLPFGLRFNPKDNNDFLIAYNSCFNGYSPFSINGFDKMLLDFLGKRDSVYQSGFECLTGDFGKRDMPVKKPVTGKNKANIEYDPVAADVEPQRENIFCSFCGAQNTYDSKFCINCGGLISGVANTREDRQTKYAAGGSSEGTFVGYYNSAPAKFARLTKRRTGEVYVIVKEFFRIGTDANTCDLVLGDNNYISRNHADMVMRNGIYYIVDNNSTNKTYVDGRAIAPNCGVEISNGAIIKLANEEFYFSIS